MAKNYSSRLCCSALNKHLLNTKCREKLLKSKPELENVIVSENTIITSVIKIYLGYISLKEFEDEWKLQKSKLKK